ncbi:MAG TPA: thiamine phosphate synthase [Candidatus Angelobacter sp.]
MAYKPMEQPRGGPILLCYITARKQFPGDEAEQRRRLLTKVAECAAAGVDYIQLREKDLPVRALEQLAGQAVAAIPPGSKTRLLVNSRIDVALACGAHGVHLPADNLAASEARAIWMRASRVVPVIGVSTHSAAEVLSAEAHGADFVLFGPVFEKSGTLNPAGLEQLKAACQRPPIAGSPMPMLALGGITLGNAQQCLQAGAAGIAAIRLFQENNVAECVQRLRGISVAGAR